MTTMSDQIQQAAKALSAAETMMRNPAHDYENVSAAALLGIGHALLAVAEELAGAHDTGVQPAAP